MGNIDLNRIYGCISTEDTLVDKAQLQIKIYEFFQKEIAEPLGKELHFEAYGKRIRGRYGNIYDDEWYKTEKLLSDGKVNKLMGGYKDFEFEAYEFNGGDIRLPWRSPEIILLNLFSKESIDAEKSHIEFSVVQWIYGEIIPNYVANAYVNLICNITNSIHSIGGIITLDDMGTFSRCHTAHERYTKQTLEQALKRSDKYFRGYQWGNVLSDKHVEILGGREKVEKEAPVYKTILLNDGGMFLQLTKDINDVKDDDLRRLKHYFKPILYMPDNPKALFPTALEEMRVIID